MSGSKFNQMHVYIIGLVLMIIVGAGMYFLLIKPILDTNKDLTGQVAAVEAQTESVDGKSFTIAQKSAADEALTEAKARRDRGRATLVATLARKRLPSSQTIDYGPDPSSASQDYVISNTLPRWLRLPEHLIKTMERYAQQSARRHRVRVVTNFTATPQSTYIWGIPRDIIARRLGGMAITGPFNNVMAWAEDWNKAPLLAAVEGLNCTVAGDKGVINASATLTVYVFPEGKLAETTPVPAAGAGGGMGGMMGGMMGGGMMGGAMMPGAQMGGGAGGGMPAKE